MEMINRCLEITAAKRAEIDEYDRRHLERKEMIARRREKRSAEVGNRQERRRQAALDRKWSHTQIGPNSPSFREREFASDVVKAFVEIDR